MHRTTQWLFHQDPDSKLLRSTSTIGKNKYIASCNNQFDIVAHISSSDNINEYQNVNVINQLQPNAINQPQPTVSEQDAVEILISKYKHLPPKELQTVRSILEKYLISCYTSSSGTTTPSTNCHQTPGILHKPWPTGANWLTISSLNSTSKEKECCPELKYKWPVSFVYWLTHAQQSHIFLWLALAALTIFQFYWFQFWISSDTMQRQSERNANFLSWLRLPSSYLDSYASWYKECIWLFPESHG